MLLSPQTREGTRHCNDSGSRENQLEALIFFLLLKCAIFCIDARHMQLLPSPDVSRRFHPQHDTCPATAATQAVGLLSGFSGRCLSFDRRRETVRTDPTDDTSEISINRDVGKRVAWHPRNPVAHFKEKKVQQLVTFAQTVDVERLDALRGVRRKPRE